MCVASLITNLTSFIDLISVMNRLGHAITRHPGVIEGIYEGLIPGGVGREMLASYLYGCYSGLAVPVYNLVPSLTTTIGVSLLPAVSAAWAVRDRRALERNVASALRLASSSRCRRGWASARWPARCCGCSSSPSRWSRRSSPRRST
ncbi:MAG: hypothetical protein ACLVL7_07390 [Anaerotruncus massiliensis (ex Togo et al. 2019)]